MLKKSGCTAIFLLCSIAMFTQNFHDLAIQFIHNESESWGLTKEDISDLRITDSHISSLSSVHHIYLQQFHENIPVRKGLASVHIDSQGKILHKTQSLVPLFSEKINQIEPILTAKNGVFSAAQKLNIPHPNHLKTINEEISADSNVQFEGRQISEQDINASLIFELNDLGELRLCWQIEIQPHGSDDYWVLYIDAETGVEINRENRVVKCNFPHPETSSLNQSDKHTDHTHSHEMIDADKLNKSNNEKINTLLGTYNAFHLPIESPLFGTRSEKNESDIANTTAAPLGWHDDGDASTDDDFTRGNHVFAYYSPLGTPSPPIPDEILCPAGIYAGGNVPRPLNESYQFTYNSNLNTATATAFLKDAITNLFVWNNYCHDVSYLYGFDEAAGNFQHTNHTGQGTGGDLILAQAQDGTKTNNASFLRQAEGSSPIMRMHLWNTNLPNTILDSSFDNLIIAHEFGHGITSRLIGGPSNVSCPGGTEHGDEGWADFFGLMMTLQDFDNDGMLEENVIGEGIRGIGNYLRNDGTSGCDDPVGNSTCGLRPTAYTTDLAINPFTYGQVPNMAVPHGVGFVWCTMLWEMTWNLINTHGFEPDIYNTSSTAGNIVAMKLVMEGLKNTACNPTFIDMRDAILAADVSLNSGANTDLIWAAFAKRGLGFSATAGGNEAFDLPTISLEKMVDKEESEIGQIITYSLTAKNNSQSALTNVIITDVVPNHLNVTSISNSGTESGGTITWPAFATIAVGSSETVSFTAEIENTAPETTVELENDLETSTSEFTNVGAWVWINNASNEANSGVRYWEHIHSPTVTESSLIMDLDLSAPKNYHLAFWQFYDVETGFDGGVIEVSTDGTNYDDLGSKMIKNGYNGSILDKEAMGLSLSVLGGRRAFTGQSGGYIKTIIDLSSYSGNSGVKVRFRFATDEDNSTYAGLGWRLDDFQLLDFENIENEGCVTETSQSYNDCGDVGDVGTIVYVAGVLPLELLDFQALSREDDILLKWKTTLEKDVSGFEIQRSLDTRNWEKIDWKIASNNPEQTNYYEFIDKDVKANVTYYYRLKMIDLDGQFEFSSIQSARLSNDDLGLTIYPNPTDGIVNLLFDNPIMEKTKIELISPNGQQILEIQPAFDTASFQIDLNQFPPNIYFIKISTAQKVVLKKLVKQKF